MGWNLQENIKGPQGVRGMRWVGEWNATDTFQTDDAVECLGRAYVLLTGPRTGGDPATDGQWLMFADRGAVGATGPAGPAPVGTGYVHVTGGVLDVPAPITPADIGAIPSGLILPGPRSYVTGINSPLTTLFKDLSNHGNDGTLTNFGGETPWAGSGTTADPYRLVFDGVDDVVSVPATQYVTTGVFSIETWFKTPISVPAYPFMWAEEGTGGVRIADLYLDSGVLSAALWGTSQVAISSGVTCNDGAFHHAVFTGDGVNMRLYCDGVLRGGPTAFPTGAIHTCVTFTIGGLDMVVNCPWLGSIALVREYPTTLTAAQVAQNFAAGPQAASGVWGDGVVSGPVVELVAAYGAAQVGG